MRKQSALLLACCSALPSSAEDYSISITWMSELINRGVSQTPNESIVEASIAVDFETGIFVGLSGYQSLNRNSRILERGTTGYVGYFAPINQDQALEVSWANYQFSSDLSREWDYQEFRLDFHFLREQSLTLAYTDDYFGGDVQQSYLGYNYQQSISERWLFKTELGVSYFSFDETQIWVENITFSLNTQLKHFDMVLGIASVDDAIVPLQISSADGTHLFASIGYTF